MTPDIRIFREIKTVEVSVLLLLWALACFVTIAFNGYYNQDLGMSVSVLDAMGETGLWEAITLNSTVFYLLRLVGDSFIFNGDYRALLFCFYITAQIYIICSLARHARFFNAIIIILVVFFTIILNQMRFGIAIGIMLSACSRLPATGSREIWKQILFCTAIILVHIFVGVFYIFYILAKRYNKLIYIVAIVLALAYSSASLLLEETRFLFYLEEEAARGSFSFLIFFVIYAASFLALDNFHRQYFLFLFLVAALTYSLASVSSRLSELSIVFLMVVLAGKEVKIWMKVVMFTVGLAFFVYRAYSWFVLDQVPLAP